MLLRGRQFKRLTEHRFSSLRKKYGLKQIELEIIAFMSKNSGVVTSTDIRSMMMLNKGQISQAMDTLCQRGYLRSGSDQDDRSVEKVKGPNPKCGRRILDIEVMSPGKSVLEMEYRHCGTKGISSFLNDVICASSCIPRFCEVYQPDKSGPSVLQNQAHSDPVEY